MIGKVKKKTVIEETKIDDEVLDKVIKIAKESQLQKLGGLQSIC